MQELNRKIPLSQVAEVLAAVGLLLWRIWSILWTRNVLDWAALLALYWIFCVFATGKRIWAPVTILTMAGLLLLYGFGQIPHAIDFAGSSP